MSQSIRARTRPVDPFDFVLMASAGDARALEDSIARGADVNAASSHGVTALIAAAAAGHAEVVRLLLRAGADVGARRGDGFNALMSGAFFGHAEVVKALLDGGADVNGKDRSGMTAHEWARAKGYLEIAHFLSGVERRAAAARETHDAPPAPAAASPPGTATFDEAGAPTKTTGPIPGAGRATGATAAGAAKGDAESDGDATLIAPAKPQAVVAAAQSPRGGATFEEAAAAVVARVRAVQPPGRPVRSRPDEYAPMGYPLGRLILLALISGLTAGATFFTINGMMSPGHTEARPAPPPPAAAEAPAPTPQDSPDQETPKQKAENPAPSEHHTSSAAAAERVAAPDYTAADQRAVEKPDKRAAEKPERSRAGEPKLISEQGRATSNQRPVSERVALPPAPAETRGAARPAPAQAGDGASTSPPRPRVAPQRTEPTAQARPDEPLAPTAKPAVAPSKKVIRWP